MCLHIRVQPSFNTAESGLCPLHLPHSSEQVLAAEQDGRAVYEEQTKGPSDKVDSSQAFQIINKCFSGLVNLPQEQSIPRKGTVGPGWPGRETSGHSPHVSKGKRASHD